MSNTNSFLAISSFYPNSRTKTYQNLEEKDFILETDQKDSGLSARK